MVEERRKQIVEERKSFGGPRSRARAFGDWTWAVGWAAS
jgi:hypothetical protein